MASSTMVRPGEQRHPAGAGGVSVDVVGVSRLIKGRRKLLNDVTLSVRPGELVAIVGGSGAGKTTLLNVMAGVAPPTAGKVLYNGLNLYENLDAFRSALGYVPQEDIIHPDLPLVTTLRYAAQLRLPAESTSEDKDQAVQQAIDVLGLGERANLPVKKLSGGQRKRASIGVELLTRPAVFFLDEPTSGLDPATSNEFMRLLRRMTDNGSTIVLTTHNIQDISLCDKVVFLARDGHLAFSGPPRAALEYFEVSSFERIYERLEVEGTPQSWSERFRGNGHFAASQAQVDDGGTPAAAAAHLPVGPLGQWLVLTRRNFDMLWRSPITLAILLGSPLMVIMMFAMLFKGGAFNQETFNPTASIMILFWVAFGAFFFGLTYGLLQICTEFPIFYRERLVNLRILPYVASKAAVLGPVLITICILMLAVLRAFDRLPALSFDAYLEMTITLTLSAFAALALGLLTSALVSNPEQATIAMPMLCFPQCLFAGAIIPVPVMALLGKALSALMSDRWSFEALGRSVGLAKLLQEGGSPLGPPLLVQYGDTFSGSLVDTWLILSAFAVVFTMATCFVLKTKSGTRAISR